MTLRTPAIQTVIAHADHWRAHADHWRAEAAKHRPGTFLHQLYRDLADAFDLVAFRRITR